MVTSADSMFPLPVPPSVRLQSGLLGLHLVGQVGRLSLYHGRLDRLGRDAAGGSESARVR
jgi:hypothetical protein